LLSSFYLLITERNYIKDKYKIREVEIIKINELIFAKATSIDTESKLKICNDPCDNEILETAIVGHANYFVTGDKRIINKKLLAELSREKIKMVNVSKYLKILNNKKLEK